ncbi:hypothetical protein CEP54_016283, partial [Fusarium duplospermum]
MIELVSPGALLVPRAAGDRLPGGAQNDQGIGVVSFLTAVGSGSVIFLIQFLLFLFLRNYLARIFKSKLYLAPPHERPERQRYGFVTTVKWLWNVRDEDTIKRCGLDAYFFLRYLQTLLAIFFPIAVVVIPVLVPLNYIGGRGSQLNSDGGGNSTGGRPDRTTGLDTLAWGNVRPTSTHRYWAHLSLSVVAVAWVCFIFFHELKRYVEVRQSYLTSADHRAKPSARTILVNSIPASLCSREKLRDLFFLFPGGVKNVWVNRDLSSLAEKIDRRDAIHRKLEQAETLLIKATQRAWRKAGKPVLRPDGVLEVATS